MEYDEIHIIYGGRSIDSWFGVYQLLISELYMHKLDSIKLYQVDAYEHSWPWPLISEKHHAKNTCVWIIGTGASSDILNKWGTECSNLFIVENHPNSKTYYSEHPEKFIWNRLSDVFSHISFENVSVSLIIQVYLTKLNVINNHIYTPLIDYIDNITMWRYIDDNSRIIREAFKSLIYNMNKTCNINDRIILTNNLIYDFNYRQRDIIDKYKYSIALNDEIMMKLLDSKAKKVMITVDNYDDYSKKWGIGREWIGRTILIIDTTGMFVDVTDLSYLVFKMNTDVNVFISYYIKGFNSFQYSGRVREGCDDIDLTENGIFFGRKHSAGFCKYMKDISSANPLPFIID